MAKKTYKFARIRYVSTEDAYYLEIYQGPDDCPADTDYGLSMICPFHRSTKHPDAPDADFIHFTLVKELVKLVEFGYQVSIC